MTCAAWTIHPRTWAIALGVSGGLWAGIIGAGMTMAGAL